MDGTPLTLDVPGLTLAALAWGPPAGLKVLALHGWLDNAASFAPLAPLLPDIRLVALDLPGHGLSDRRPAGVGYHFVDWVVDVAAAADALGWERFGLLGHSMGAGIASLVAGALPERVERVALIEGLGPFATSADEAPLRLAKSIARRAQRERKRPRAHPTAEVASKRLQQVVPGLSPEAAALLVKRGVQSLPDGSVTWRSDPRLRGLSPLRLSEEHVRSFLRRIACPAVLLRALEGYPFDMKTMSGRIGCLDVRVEELAGAHHVHMDRPHAVADLLNPFFAETTTVPSARERLLSQVGVTLADLRQLKGVRAVVLDVDGVLTEGTLNYGTTATDRYAFSVRDGLGIKMLQRAGIPVALLSGRSSDPVRARARDLGIEHAILGVEVKLPRLRQLAEALNVELSQIAYMGDDLNDLAVLKSVGYPTAPANASPEVLKTVRFVAGATGGRGAVRELAEHVLKAQGHWSSAVAHYDRGEEVSQTGP